MQQFKNQFNDPNHKETICNVQKCLRLTDLDEIGDSTHLLTFQMIGLFSFRQWTVPETINFFMEFLNRLNLKPDYITIHPDKINDWSSYYNKYDVEIREDQECLWSDGNIGGYCTEFYIDDIEIGNIVNTNGDCIDVGFGLERLVQVIDKNYQIIPKLEILENTCFELIKNGITVGDYKNFYILKKLIVLSLKNGSKNNHPFFEDQRNKIVGNYRNYLRTKKKPKFKNKDSSYWQNTFGIDENNLEFYEKLYNSTQT